MHKCLGYCFFHVCLDQYRRGTATSINIYFRGECDGHGSFALPTGEPPSASITLAGMISLPVIYDHRADICHLSSQTEPRGGVVIMLPRILKIQLPLAIIYFRYSSSMSKKIYP
jgi:hypothetical protein